MKNDKLKVILLIISSIILLFLIVYKFDDVKKEIFKKSETNNDNIDFKNEYEQYNDQKNSSGKNYIDVEIDENNKIKYATADEIVEIINNGTSVIYLGYPQCPWCRNAVPILIKAANDTALDKIYYMNINEERDSYIVENEKLIKTKEGTEDYKKLLKALDPILDEYIVDEKDTGEKRIYVPLVVFVREGEIIGFNVATIPSQKDPYVLLTDEQKEELYNVYSSYIHKVLNDVCDDRC